jgi:uncharacterized protein YbgA (DUF1722 family)/uncharacterized protein YbbK (DUF523 family)
MDLPKIKMGVSSCLLGEKVRYDGQAKLDHYVRDTLGHYVEFVPVCPEFELGLGVPRETMRLVGDPENPRLVTTKTKVDLTERMLAWCGQRVSDLEGEGLCGFIFKSKSPSSGMERVKVYQASGMAVKKGRGLFAKAFMDRFPLLPVEEEGRLNDPAIRENFIEQVFTLQRWRDMLRNQGDAAGLVKFHSEHKYLLMAHSVSGYRELGRLVADLKGVKLAAAFVAYHEQMMKALRLQATVKKQVNVLQHMAGYFKRQLSADEKQELQEIIGQYHQGLVPLIVPITLINHYVRKYDEPYLASQFYLHPHPIELQLRNRV